MQMKTLCQVILACVTLGCAPIAAFGMFDAIAENATADARHFVSGNQLLALRGDKGSVSLYVAGVMDRDSGYDALGGPSAGLSYCVPSEVTLRQATDVLIRYLDERPAERHKAAAYLVRAALIAAFPCATK